MTLSRVVVVGSINRDYVCRVAALPKPGETMLGGDLSLGAGGKGGNQAVAVARMGVPCALVGAVGADSDGQLLREILEDEGVDVSGIAVDGHAVTGAAFVFVDPNGENSIVVAPGANASLTAEATRVALSSSLSAADVLVTQAEIRLEALTAAVETAAQIGARVVLNLAPYQPVPPTVLLHCDPLVVNEVEARNLLDLDHDADVLDSELARGLAALARSAVVTLGARGAIVAHDGMVDLVPAEAVDVVDSTGAGDAFTGSLAARLTQGSGLVSAVELGVAAGTYAVQRLGAQASYPTGADLLH